MSEFFFTLSFFIFPLLTVCTFAIIAPPLGATLSLRNEILLGIALPPVGSAIIAGAIFIGVPPNATILLYILAALVIFFVMIFLPLNISKKRVSIRRRELILAALFCIGNTLVMIFMAISPRVEAHFKNLLQGELLTVSGIEYAITGIFALALLSYGLLNRGFLYAFSIDEEGLRIKEKSYVTITILYRAAATLVITGGIILIGPLLTTALLIVPPFLTERLCRGLDKFMILNMVLGLLGTVIGFLIAVLVNLPPAPVCVFTIIVLGIFFQWFGKK